MSTLTNRIQEGQLKEAGLTDRVREVEEEVAGKKEEIT